jgi:hypothetical protein
MNTFIKINRTIKPSIFGQTSKQHEQARWLGWEKKAVTAAKIKQS